MAAFGMALLLREKWWDVQFTERLYVLPHDRYFVLGQVLVFAMLLMVLAQFLKKIKLLAILVCVPLFASVTASDYLQEPFVDFRWKYCIGQYLEIKRSAGQDMKGKVVQIPINPPGWHIHLKI